MNVCPSDFATDDNELHAGNADMERHIQGCVACQKRRQDRASAVTFFEDVLAAPTWTRVVSERASRSPRRRLRAIGWPVGLLLGLGVASVVVVVVAADRRPPGAALYVAAKGHAAAEIICRRGDSTSVVATGDVVAPGDLLRFRPLSMWPGARFIQIGSVDGTGSYTSFYPARDDAISVALPANGLPLEGSIRLDAAPGPERVFVVVSMTPISATDVRRVAEANAHRQALVDTIANTPVRGAWIVLTKANGPAGPGTVH